MAAIHLQTLPDREEQLHLMQEDARYDVADDGDKDHTCIPDPSVFPAGTAQNTEGIRFQRLYLQLRLLRLPLQQREAPPLQPRAP